MLRSRRAARARESESFLRTNVPKSHCPTKRCRHVAARLAARSLDRVPVVADESGYQLIGIVSRHDLVKPSLSIFNEERERERFRRVSLTRGKDAVALGDRAPRE